MASMYLELPEGSKAFVRRAVRLYGLENGLWDGVEFRPVVCCVSGEHLASFRENGGPTRANFDWDLFMSLLMHSSHVCTHDMVGDIKNARTKLFGL
mmetsp:Transcript_50947/g.124140  ORF Transcript_50947/g.124140 Transcript_50947/m.124140 type:complete len:96 (+) Transcript_50947:399-686(+)